MPIRPGPTGPETSRPDPVTITKKADAVSDARSYFFALPNGDKVEVRVRAVGATAAFESHVRAFAEGLQDLPVAPKTSERPMLAVVA